MMAFVLDTDSVENLEKGGNAGYQHFLLLPGFLNVFKGPLSEDHQNHGIMWSKDKRQVLSLMLQMFLTCFKHGQI